MGGNLHGKKTVFQHIMLHLVLIGLAVLFLVPLLWMVSTSLKPIEETMVEKPVWIPQKQLVHKYRDPARLYFEAQYQGTAVQGTVATGVKAQGSGVENSEGGVLFSMSDPIKYRGVTAMVAASTIKEIDRVGKVVSLDLDSVQTKGYVVYVLDDISEIGVLEPESRKGEKVRTETARTKPVYETAPQWQNYKDAISYGEETLGYKPFLVYARNTLLVCVLTVFGTVFSNAIVAYSFSRLRWKGRELCFAITLATMMIPFPVLMVPVFSLFVKLDWVGTFRPLWVPAWFGSAFSIFLLRQFFRTIPFELSEAAKLDGCSEWAIFTRIIAPLAKPALAVVALFSFMGAWNDFLGPLIYLHSQDQFTLAVGLQFYRSQQANQWHLLMAATTVVVAPVMVLFFFTQKLFMQGIAATGLKG